MVKKRFIAGAICSHCGVIDRIQIYEKLNIFIRECFHCGNKEGLTKSGGMIQFKSKKNNFKKTNQIHSKHHTHIDKQNQPEPLRIINNLHSNNTGNK